MEPRQTELRETVVANNGQTRVREARKSFDPTRIFVEKDRLAWFWFGFAVLVLVGAAVDRHFLIQSFRQGERVVVIDPSDTFYVAPLLKFEDATKLQVEQSKLATVAFLSRNPNGFDNGELLKQMFLKRAYQKAQAYEAAEEPEFNSKQLHQKAEISGVDVLNTRENFVLTQVSGQLIRAGEFEGKPFAESVPFKLLLRLQRNPDMVSNGRFPTAVNDFKYETLPH
jgi:hypothetical protein